MAHFSGSGSPVSSRCFSNSETLEGQVEEGAQDRLDVSVKTFRQGAMGKRAGERIRCIGMGAAAKEIAWELIKQKEQGERAVRCFLPIRQFAA